jgi:hypothetical protein
MRIFLDDERKPPEGWLLVGTPQKAIEWLQTGSVEEISLDHDLGDGPDNGYQAVNGVWLTDHVPAQYLRPIARASEKR